jgi:hypothetical protein
VEVRLIVSCHSNLFSPCSPSLVHLVAAVLPDDAASPILAVEFRVGAGLAFFQALLAITILVLVTPDDSVSFGVKTANLFIVHGR